MAPRAKPEPETQAPAPEQAATAPAEQAVTVPDTGGGLTLQAVNDKVDQLIDAVKRMATGTRRTQADQTEAVAQAARDEIGKLHQAEEAERRRKGLHDRVDELEDKIRQVTEKVPREYRPITRALWVEPDDE